jgi:hypothetical protein
VPQDKSYTHTTVETHNIEKTKYELWRLRQLMADVVRVQIQQEAVQEAYAHRLEAFKGESVFPSSLHEESTVTNLMPVRPSRLHPHGIPMLTLRIKSAFLEPRERFPGVLPNLYYVSLHVGGCLCRTEACNPTPKGVRWDRVKASGKVPINDVQVDECIVEILDENPNTPAEVLVGRGHTSIDHTLGYNMGRETEFRVDIMTREKVIFGTLIIVLMLDVDEFASTHVADPKNLRYYEINRKVSKLKKIEMGLDASPSVDDSVVVDAPNSINSEVYASLSTLVGDLRGDGIDFIKLLTGDVKIADLRRVGADVNNKIVQVRLRFPSSLFLFIADTLMMYFPISLLPCRICRTSDKRPSISRRKRTGTSGSWTRCTSTSRPSTRSWRTSSRSSTRQQASWPRRSAPS